jgi:dihydrofolate reductase
MAKVIADMSMSLDGYVADENDGINEVFEWFLAGGPEEYELGGIPLKMTKRNYDRLMESFADVGAVISGRRTADLANAWGGQHTVGVPAFVVTHRPPPDHIDPETSTVYFVDSPEEAVRQAKEAAGDKAVGVAGGDTVRQLLELGLLDEVRINLVPVKLEGPEVTEGDGVTHLQYRVVR